MTPLSYQGFGFTAILVMVGILSAAHLLKYLKERFFQHQEDKKAKRPTLNALCQPPAVNQKIELPQSHRQTICRFGSVPVFHAFSPSGLIGYKLMHCFL